MNTYWLTRKSPATVMLSGGSENIVSGWSNSCPGCGPRVVACRNRTRMSDAAGRLCVRAADHPRERIIALRIQLPQTGNTRTHGNSVGFFRLWPKPPLRIRAESLWAVTIRRRPSHSRVLSPIELQKVWTAALFDRDRVCRNHTDPSGVRATDFSTRRSHRFELVPASPRGRLRQGPHRITADQQSMG